MQRMNDRVDSKFRFVLLSAQRTEQMMRGAAAKVEIKGNKMTRSAMEEILSGLVKWDYGPAPAPPTEESSEEEQDSESEIN